MSLVKHLLIFNSLYTVPYATEPTAQKMCVHSLVIQKTTGTLSTCAIAVYETYFSASVHYGYHVRRIEEMNRMALPMQQCAYNIL